MHVNNIRAPGRAEIPAEILPLFVMFGRVILYLLKFYEIIKMFMISFINSERKLRYPSK